MSGSRGVPPSGDEVELDAYEVHKSNPHLRAYMKACGLSVDDVRKHGSVTINVVPNLGELIAATNRRG